jgi:hypothetical protein
MLRCPSRRLRSWTLRALLQEQDFTARSRNDADLPISARGWSAVAKRSGDAAFASSRPLGSHERVRPKEPAILVFGFDEVFRALALKLQHAKRCIEPKPVEIKLNGAGPKCRSPKATRFEVPASRHFLHHRLIQCDNPIPSLAQYDFFHGFEKMLCRGQRTFHNPDFRLRCLDWQLG